MNTVLVNALTTTPVWATSPCGTAGAWGDAGLGTTGWVVCGLRRASASVA